MAEKLSIVIYTTTYAPWEEHQDEPEKLAADEEVVEFDDLDDAVEMMQYCGFTDFSQEPGWSATLWYSTESYLHPYTGEQEEKTAHLRNFSDDDSRELWRRLGGKY